MTIYLSLFLIPILLNSLPIKFNEYSNRALLISFAILCAILIGFKYQVGGDWGVYEKYIIGANAVNFKAMLSTKDPGFMSLLWISSYLGLGQTGINLFCSSIFMLGLYRVCKNQPYPWLAFIVAFPYLITVVGFGYTRQSMVIGIFFLAYTYWQEDKKFSSIKILSLIAFGFLFHKSILIFSPLIFIQKNGFIVNKKLLIISLPILLVLTLYYYSYLQLIWKFYVVQSQLHSTISESSQASVAYGSAIRSYMNIPAFILFYFFYKKFEIFNDRRLLLIASIVSIILIVFTPYASTLLDRLGLYFILFQILIYSRIPLFFKDIHLKNLYVYGVTIFYLIVFIVWFNYSNSSVAWKPYKITLFKPTYYINSWILSDELVNFNVTKSIEQLEEYNQIIEKYGQEGLETKNVNELLKKDRTFKY
tara:strand:+ start:177 stop:1436 length:1260 start_codon:yes stop_codon:yes gene_type:complete